MSNLLEEIQQVATNTLRRITKAHFTIGTPLVAYELLHGSYKKTKENIRQTGIFISDFWKNIQKDNTAFYAQTLINIDDYAIGCAINAIHLATAARYSIYCLTEQDEQESTLNEDISNTQEKIKEITNAMRELLLYKNQKYGDSALKPKQIFYKGNATSSILIRLDDKLGRIMSNTDATPRINDVADIIGYCTLLLIGMGATADDIQKLRD